MDILGSLWMRGTIQRGRVSSATVPQEFSEIVVAVDAPIVFGARADECGIIVAGRNESGAIYVLADLTTQGDTPAGWGARVVGAYRRYSANRVTAESNYGDEMVANVLRQCDANLPVRLIEVRSGRYLRAEPVAAAYERGLVHHVGVFAKLEDQLCRLGTERHFPTDRIDALILAIADLTASQDSSPEFFTPSPRRSYRSSVRPYP